MSEQNNNAETTVLSREDGTQYTVEPFKLSKTKEIADRYRGEHTINIQLPVAVKGDLQATLRNLQAFVSPEADFGEVLVAKFNGQGLRLDAQKEVKEFLSAVSDSAPWRKLVEEGASMEDVLGLAQQEVDGFRLGAPRQRKAGGKQSGKVAQAEAKAAKAVGTALSMYRELSPVLRSQYRQQLIDMGAVSAEELDAVDAEGQAEEPKKGGKR